MPWPRYPVLTATGKPSLAKTAGKPLPWLSANVVGNLGRRQHRVLHAIWRDAMTKAAAGLVYEGALPVRFEITLVKPRGYRLDAFAVLEGFKPCLDGITNAGMFPDDNPTYVVGGDGHSIKGDYAIFVRFIPCAAAS